MIEAKNFKESETLKNGTSVTIRAIRPDDKDRLNEAFINLEPESVYTRFFRYKNQLSDQELKSATEVDFENQVALVVTISHGDKETIIGGGRYITLPSELSRRSAEVAFAVEEDYQGQGIASHILKRLARIAREKGLTQFEAEVLMENKAMTAVFAKSGLTMTKKFEDGVIHVIMSLTDNTS